MSSADVGTAVAGRRVRHGAVRGRRRASTPAAPAGANGRASARRADLRATRPARGRDGPARGGLRALGLLVRAGRAELVDRHADLLQADRDVVEPGRLAAPVGLPAVALLERRAVPDPPPAARHRAVRDGGARRRGRLLPVPDALLRQPVRHAREPARGGQRAQPAAAPPGDDVPPADALHGLRRLHDPVRVRGRRAAQAAHRRRSGSARRAGSRSSPGPSSASGSCSARCGRTRSSAGAATGPGTRSRTRR